MMEAKRPVIRLIIIALLAITMSGCSAMQRSIHDMAISLETGRAGLEADSVEIEEGRIALLRSEEGGEREPLVLVHGFGANKENWLRLSQQLWDDFDIIAPDLPGHGDSVQDMALSYRIPEQARRLGAILDQLDIERAHLAGNSMGGAIAAVFAAEHPERVMSLSLLDTGGVHRHPSKMDELIEQGKNPLLVKDSEGYARLVDFAMEKPNARLEILDGIGHVPMIEAPEKTAELIRETASEAR